MVGWASTQFDSSKCGWDSGMARTTTSRLVSASRQQTRRPAAAHFSSGVDTRDIRAYKFTPKPLPMSVCAECQECIAGNFLSPACAEITQMMHHPETQRTSSGPLQNGVRPRRNLEG